MLKLSLNKTGFTTRNSQMLRQYTKVSSKGDETPGATVVYNRLAKDEVQWRSALRRGTRNNKGWRQPFDYERSIIQTAFRDGKFTHIRNNAKGDPQYFFTYTGESAAHVSAPIDTSKLLDATHKLRWSVNDLFRAHTEALVKLKNQKVNYGEALAESKKTFQHLSSTFQTVMKAYRYAKRGKWKQVLKSLRVKENRKFQSSREGAARWLELQFAWTPLLSDIYGTGELLKQKLREVDQVYSVVRSIKSSIDGSDVSQQKQRSFAIGSGYRVTKTKLYFRLKKSELAYLTSIGLTDPLQVAWAIVPFSFMVDWFLPVGSMLEALGASKGLEFVSGTDVTYAKFLGIYNTEPISRSTSPLDFYSGSFTHFCVIEATRREVLNSFPVPFLYVKSPFSTSHAISALAVLRSIT